MYKKLIILFLVLIIFMGVVSAEDNVTIVADNTIDDTSIDDGKDFNEIKESIDKANEADTIQVNGTYHASKDYAISISKSLTIEGVEDTVFDCEDHILHIFSSKSLTLKNIRFTNIDQQGETDGVILGYGDLRIINCTFDNICSSVLLMSRGQSVIVEDCVIENGVYSGDMFSSNEDYYSPECYFTLKNSRIINSTASNLLNIFNSESTIISDNLIYNNTFRQNLITSVDSRSYKIIEYKKFTFTGNTLASNLKDDLTVPKITIEPPYLSEGPSYDILLTTVVKDNFWGRNIYDPLEFTVLNYITYSHTGEVENSMTWCNVELEKINDTSYRLSYVNSNGQEVNLKSPAFNIIDKQNGEVLASNINIGVFNTTKNINTSNVYIKTLENIIINKDPAKIVYTVTGNTYADLKVKMTLYDPNTNLTLADEYVRFDIYALWSETGSTLHNFYRVHTGSDGSKICDGESETPGQYYLYGFIQGPYELYTFKTTFANEDYGLTQEEITVKIKKPVLKVILNPVTATYGSSKSVTINVKDAETNMDISDVYLSAKIYKGKKIVKEYNLYVKKGTMTFKISKLNAGSYTIRFVCYDDEKTMKDKIIKLTINKKKLTVKAPKVTAKYKKSKTFKITIKNAGKTNVKVKLKIGKKIYKVKTNKRGVAKFNTKKLKVGNYKVKITSNDGNYKFSAKSKITIKR